MRLQLDAEEDTHSLKSTEKSSPRLDGESPRKVDSEKVLTDPLPNGSEPVQITAPETTTPPHSSCENESPRKTEPGDALPAKEFPTVTESPIPSSRKKWEERRPTEGKDKAAEREKEKGIDPENDLVRVALILDTPKKPERVGGSVRRRMFDLPSAARVERKVELKFTKLVPSNSLLPSLAGVEVMFPLPHSHIAIAFKSSDLWILDTTVGHPKYGLFP